MYSPVEKPADELAHCHQHHTLQLMTSLAHDAVATQQHINTQHRAWIKSSLNSHQSTDRQTDRHG